MPKFPIHIHICNLWLYSKVKNHFNTAKYKWWETQMISSPTESFVHLSRPRSNSESFMNRPITIQVLQLLTDHWMHILQVIILTYTNKEISVCRVWPRGRQRIKSTANRRWWIKTDPLHTGVESCVEKNWSWWDTNTYHHLHFFYRTSFKYQLCCKENGLNPYWTTLTHTALSAIWRL